MSNFETLKEKAKSLSQDQKNALLGYLIGRLQDDEIFPLVFLEGIEIVKQVEFDENGESRFINNKSVQ
jgi:hypothetical protein